MILDSQTFQTAADLFTDVAALSAEQRLAALALLSLADDNGVVQVPPQHELARMCRVSLMGASNVVRILRRSGLLRPLLTDPDKLCFRLRRVRP